MSKLSQDYKHFSHNESSDQLFVTKTSCVRCALKFKLCQMGSTMESTVEPIVRREYLRVR